MSALERITDSCTAWHEVRKWTQSGRSGLSARTTLQSSFSAEGLRRKAEGPNECTTHAFAIHKSRFVRDHVSRVPSLLHHDSGRLQPKLFNSFCRRLAGFGQKC